MRKSGLVLLVILCTNVSYAPFAIFRPIEPLLLFSSYSLPHFGQKKSATFLLLGSALFYRYYNAGNTYYRLSMPPSAPEQFAIYFCILRRVPCLNANPSLLTPFSAIRSLLWRQLAATIAQIFRLPYSHSIVPGGLLVISYTTRLTSCTSAMMRLAIFLSTG